MMSSCGGCGAEEGRTSGDEDNDQRRGAWTCGKADEPRPTRIPAQAEGGGGEGGVQTHESARNPRGPRPAPAPVALWSPTFGALQPRQSRPGVPSSLETTGLTDFARQVQDSALSAPLGRHLMNPNVDA